MAQTVSVQEIADAVGARVVGDGSTTVSGIAHDTRRPIAANDLFVCLVGQNFDGRRFAAQALAQGAAAILTNSELPVAAPQLVVTDTRRAMGLAASIVYGRPSEQMRVIGVTGTKGKTTTTFLIKQLLEHNGRRVGLVGTNGLVIGAENDATPFSTSTTPESADLQVMFSRMVHAGCDTAVTEVSSHAMPMQRVSGAEYDIAVFTNITPDHLDFHPDFADYLTAKTAFFTHVAAGGVKSPKGAVVNRDDPNWSAFAAAAGDIPVISVGIQDEVADLRAINVLASGGSTSFTLTGQFGTVPVNMPLPGVFNVYNALCAAGAVLHEGMSLVDIAAALSRLQGVPGRFEKVPGGQGFDVFVDYAHTGPSMENVLQLARSFTKGRVIVVFGAGGDRARLRRSEMGAVAGRLADYVIVTSDNPRSENPADICEEIAAAIRKTAIDSSCWEVIIDRRTAIAKAVDLAQPGDTVIIAGKGHETYQEIKGVREHFDDREEAYRALHGKR